MSGTASSGTLVTLHKPVAIRASVNRPMINLFFIEKEIIELIMMILCFF
jgi:hypothetical protein